MESAFKTKAGKVDQVAGLRGELPGVSRVSQKVPFRMGYIKAAPVQSSSRDIPVTNLKVIRADVMSPSGVTETMPIVYVPVVCETAAQAASRKRPREPADKKLADRLLEEDRKEALRKQNYQAILTAKKGKSSGTNSYRKRQQQAPVKEIEIPSVQKLHHNMGVCICYSAGSKCGHARREAGEIP